VFQLHEICSVDSQKIIKIVATRCQILRLKCTKFDFFCILGLRPRPRSESLRRSPDPLAGFEGPTSKGGEGREGERREEEAFLVMWPRRLSALNPPLVPMLTWKFFQELLSVQCVF